MFWDQANKTFEYIGDDDKHWSEAFESLVALADVVDSYSLPTQAAPIALALALDIVVERAIFEMLERTPKSSEESVQTLITTPPKKKIITEDNFAGSELDGTNSGLNSAVSGVDVVEGGAVNNINTAIVVLEGERDREREREREREVENEVVDCQALSLMMPPIPQEFVLPDLSVRTGAPKVIIGGNMTQVSG